MGNAVKVKPHARSHRSAARKKHNTFKVLAAIRNTKGFEIFSLAEEVLEKEEGVKKVEHAGASMTPRLRRVLETLARKHDKFMSQIIRESVQARAIKEGVK